MPTAGGGSRSGTTVGLDDRIEGRGAAVADTTRKFRRALFQAQAQRRSGNTMPPRLIRIGSETRPPLPHDYKRHGWTPTNNMPISPGLGRAGPTGSIATARLKKPIASKLLYIEQPDAARTFSRVRRSARWRPATSLSTRPDDCYDAFATARAASAITASRRNAARGFTSRLSTLRRCGDVEYGRRRVFCRGRGSDLPGRPSACSRIWRSAR